MKSEIVFTSSYSSQLGALISLSKYFKNKDLENQCKNIIVFHISSKGDPNCRYSCFVDNGRIILGSNYKIKKNIFIIFYIIYQNTRVK